MADMLITAIRQGKVLPQEGHLYDTVGERSGADMVCRLLNAIPDRTRLSELIEDKHEDRGNWRLEEYRKYASSELRDNPALYSQLFEKEGGRPDLTADALEYYRRNNHEYLRAHPEEYNRLANKP